MSYQVAIGKVPFAEAWRFDRDRLRSNHAQKTNHTEEDEAKNNRRCKTSANHCAIAEEAGIQMPCSGHIDSTLGLAGNIRLFDKNSVATLTEYSASGRGSR
jgi:hypothetical protein